MDEIGVFEIAGSDGWAVEFAAFESGSGGGEIEASFCFLALVTGEAAVFEDGENGLVEVEVVGLVVLELGRDGLDAGVEEVVYGVVSGEGFAGFGDRDGGGFCEVVTGGLAAFLPVGGVFFSKGGATGGVGFFNPCEVVFFEGGEVLVGVGDFVFGWGEEVPIGGVLEGNGGDEFARFGAISGGADELLHGDEMLAAGGGEGSEGLFISGGDEAEVRVAGGEEVVLVGGESEGSL